MSLIDNQYNKMDEFDNRIKPSLLALSDLLNSYGINFFFSACIAKDTPVDGQDSVTFVHNLGSPSCHYNSQKIAELLLLVTNRAILVTDPDALKNGVFVPKAVPRNAKNN